jgi:hypothetical protein
MLAISSANPVQGQWTGDGNEPYDPLERFSGATSSTPSMYKISVITGAADRSLGALRHGPSWRWRHWEGGRMRPPVRVSS